MAEQGALLGASYALCCLDALTLVVNIMLTVMAMVHRKLRKEQSLRYIRFGTFLLAVSHLMIVSGALLLALWPDTGTPSFCQAGGFLMTFGFLEATWMLFVCCVSLMVHLRSKVKGQFPRSGHRWNFPIFMLSMLLKGVVLGMLVFLSLTKTDFFKEQSDTTCRLLRLHGNDLWGYTLSLVIIAWAAVVPATIISLCNMFLYHCDSYSTCKNRYAKHGGMAWREDEGKLYKRLSVCFLCASLLWTMALMTVTVLLFSDNDVMTEDIINLALGYTFTLAVLIGSIHAVAVLLMNTRGSHRSLLICDRDDEDGLLKGEPPSSLLSLSKLPQQNDEIRRYQTQWVDVRTRQPISGVMKVYHPACVSRWRSEVTAVSRLGPAGHPNIARYLWQTSRNRYAAGICTFTGDILSPESSITCMLWYPGGTLARFMETRSQLTEVVLHKVTLDVARGLGFLHQHHLVHNALTSDSIYMASMAGKVGLRAVIGDFDHSYEVSENTLRKSPLVLSRPSALDNCSFGSLYSISQQLDLDNNKFAPDIRSFGMVVLEMLIALGEFDENSAAAARHRKQDSQRRNSAYDNTGSVASSVMSAVSANQPIVRKQVLPAGVGSRQLDSVNSDSEVTYYTRQQQQQQQQQQEGGHSHVHGNQKCKCSPRVTDIRAVRSRSCDNTPVHLHGDSGVDTESICSATQSSVTPYNKSAFASVKTLRDSSPETRKPKSESVIHELITHKPPTDSGRRARDIQNRDLPPVPPKVSGKGTGRRLRQRPTCDIIRAEVGQMSMMKPNKAPSTDSSSASSPLTPQSPELSSPSDGDFYSLSVGSIGSFETIYEDEERSSNRQPVSPHLTSSIPRSGSRNIAGKPPAPRRKDDTGGRKRFSVSSANDSVFSTDSGVGSYASDTYTYSDNTSQGYSHRKWRDLHRGRTDTDSPDKSYVLRVRKQPCSKHHPEPGHICCSDPGLNMAQTDTDTANTDTLSSDEPTYESINPRRSCTPLGKASRNSRPRCLDSDSLHMSSTESLRIPIQDLVSGVPHPALRQQYRFAVPRLGVSAVLARRLSDTSLSSLNSCSTYKSTDIINSTDVTSHKQSTSTNPAKVSNGPNDKQPTEVTTKDTGESLSSSIMSIIQDSKTLLDPSGDQVDHMKSVSPVKVPNPSRFSGPVNKSPAKTSLTKAQLNQYNELTKFSQLLDTVNLEPREKAKMLSMLRVINNNDKLGYIGHQLMSLFSDCWLEEPVPTAGEILKRLHTVLPTASV